MPFFSCTGPVDAEAAGLQVGVLRKEAEHDRVMFQAQIGVELAGALVLGEPVGDPVQDDRDVAVGR
jgi:hypothetical protein